MVKPKSVVLLAYAAVLAWNCAPTNALGADDTPIETTVTVDAAQTLRDLDHRRLGGTNVAMLYKPETYFAPDVQKLVADLHPRYIRIPGGPWANGVYWNGHGVRGADGNVDPSKVGPDGYPAVDYSDYAPSFLVDTKTLHPASNCRAPRLVAQARSPANPGRCASGPTCGSALIRLSCPV